MRDSCIHVRPRPPAARSGAGPRRKRRRPRRFLLGLVAAAVLAHSTPGLADDRPSPGLLLRRARYALAAGGQSVSVDQMQPGDVVTQYSDASHVGIYVGDGLMVHASTYGIPVRVESVYNSPIYNVRRY